MDREKWKRIIKDNIKQIMREMKDELVVLLIGLSD